MCCFLLGTSAIAESNGGNDPEEPAMLYFSSADCYAIAQSNSGHLYKWRAGSIFQDVNGHLGRTEVETMSLNYNGTVIYAVDANEFGTVDKDLSTFHGYGHTIGTMSNSVHGSRTVVDVDGLAINSNTGFLYAVERSHSDNDMLFVIDRG